MKSWLYGARLGTDLRSKPQRSDFFCPPGIKKLNKFSSQTDKEPDNSNMFPMFNTFADFRTTNRYI